MTVPQQWWVDPAWDPMQELQDCKREIIRMSQVINQLIQATNTNDHNITCLVQQNQQLTGLYRRSQCEITKLTEELERLTAKQP